MSPWSTGRAAVEELVAAGKLSRLTGADAGRPGLMRRAHQQLASAAALAKSDPATAYVIAYDAAKHAALALLAEQDLRPTTDGGHVAMEKALTAQFQGVFSGFGRLRRRRHELDYPSGDDDIADTAEAMKAIAAATSMVADADQILSQGLSTVF
jgi:uncharacterized protein (UPF0332 family)